MKKKLIMVLSACFLVVGVTACGNAEETPKTDTAAKTQNDIKKIVETKELELQVASVKSGYAESSDKNKQMLIVEMNIKNTTKEESGAGAADFVVKADNGKTYKVYGLEAKNFGDVIPAGKTLTGKGYYEIPKDTKAVTFYYEPAGKRQAEWHLDVPAK